MSIIAERTIGFRPFLFFFCRLGQKDGNTVNIGWNSHLSKVIFWRQKLIQLETSVKNIEGTFCLRFRFHFYDRCNDDGRNPLAWPHANRPKTSVFTPKLMNQEHSRPVYESPWWIVSTIRIATADTRNSSWLVTKTSLGKVLVTRALHPRHQLPIKDAWNSYPIMPETLQLMHGHHHQPGCHEEYWELQGILQSFHGSISWFTTKIYSSEILHSVQTHSQHQTYHLRRCFHQG